MPDQFARWTIYAGPFKVVEFFAREIEDLRADHHSDVEALAVDNIAGHDRPPVEAPEPSCAFRAAIAR
jgi:hypothetical protein